MSEKLSLRTAGLGLSLIACLTLTLAGCSNDAAEPQPTTSAAKAGSAAFPKVTGGYGENPTISKPTGKQGNNSKSLHGHTQIGAQHGSETIGLAIQGEQYSFDLFVVLKFYLK